MLTWEGPDVGGVFRACDEHARYVISLDHTGRYCVGFFPSPGPECLWGVPLASLEEAKTAAEKCVTHVHNVWGHRVSDTKAAP